MIWYKLKEKRPLAYKTGMFDGKKSDKVLSDLIFQGAFCIGVIFLFGYFTQLIIF